MVEKKTLISFREYLEKNKTFVIPEYQRGYVWGKRRDNEEDSVTHLMKALVSGFSDTGCREIFLQGVTVTESANEIAIIDGQQRTTFLYLLMKSLGYDGAFRLRYMSGREESQQFIDSVDVGGVDVEDEKEPFQDIYFFKKTIRTVKELIGSLDKAAFVGYLLDNVKFLYVDIPESQASRVFTMMNGNKAVMLPEEVIKAEILRLASKKDSLPEADGFNAEWDANLLRSRYAREWDKWLYWWNREDVQKMFGCTNTMGLLISSVADVGDGERLTFDLFRRKMLPGRSEKEAKLTFDRLRRRQKLFEDLFNGYEQPFDQLQLCDGQQRITTLFLLLGMLNRHLGDDSLKKYLISNYEEEDDREPYLRYSIRESSLYFMSDLVCRFFICGGRANWPVAISDIRNEAWYFNDYERDPSIRSMLRALDIIERQIGMHSDVDWNAFAEFLLNRLTFMYYDMGSRENGEETFVVINTTGEPLSVAQNLKPRVSGARINEAEENLIARWEEIETWFWQKRCNDNDTADAGMGEFLRWVTLLHYIDKRDDETVSLILESGTYSFPVNEIGFKKVYSAFGAVRNIYEKYKGCDDSLADPDHLSPSRTKWCLELNELYKFLPVIRYVERFEEATSLDVCRVFRYFQNVAGYLSKDITVKNRSVSQAVRLVTEMAGKDILSFLSCEDASKHILPDEERRKLEILAEASGERENLEKMFWQVQGFRLFLGEITPILDWSMRDGSFDPELFGSYVAKVVDCIEADGKARDLVRRALLSYELDGYPVRNGKNLSFCGEDWQWKRITSENSCRIKAFLDELIAGADVQSIIGRCARGSKWYGVAADAAVLNYCEEKNIQEDMSEGIILIKKKRATTWFPMRLLDDTRERFGAEGIQYFDSRSIGFTRTIDGRVMHFQRWLEPGDGEVDLYLMSSADPESYVEGEDAQGENDLARFVCLAVADEMDSGEISEGMRLMAHKGSDVAATP